MKPNFNNLEQFVDVLEKNNQLIRIKEYVNPELEITEIVDRISKNESQNKAILFENNGTKFPLLINSMGNDERIKLALRVDDLNDLGKEIEAIFSDLSTPKNSWLDKLKILPTLGKFASYMPKVKNGKGPCQEIIIDQPNLDDIPVLKCWPLDGGKFITLPAVHTKDPLTNIRNIGMYRMQIFDHKTTGMHWHKHKVSARHFEEYKKLNKRMPIAVALGGDPVYTYAATAPLPDHVDEYILAGFLRKRKVELVKCITQPDIEVPADADIIIEGYIDPNEDKAFEGPFGDHTGFYSLPDWYPKFHVTCITHKKNAIYPATIVGIPPQEDAWIGKATEKIFLTPMKLTMIPELLDMHMPMEGVFHNLVLAKINKTYPGQALKVMNAMWGAGQMMFNKMLVIVDEDINLEDYPSVSKSLFQNLNPEYDIHTSVGPMDVLDHSCSALGFGGKICFDATRKFVEETKGRKHITYLHEKVNLEKSLLEIDGIKTVNSNLINHNYSVLFIGVEKKKSHEVSILHNKICEQFDELPKLILYVDNTKLIHSISDVLWIWCNNTDPSRDVMKKNGCVGIDGTRKSNELDQFERNWPNIICSTRETIQKIDSIWDKLNLGAFIESPSLKYLDDVIGNHAEAIFNEKNK